MKGLSQRLQENKEIGLLALDNKSDEEIAKQFKTTPYFITTVRRSLGILRSRVLKPITGGQWRSVSFAGGYHYAKFPLNKMEISDLGYDPEKKLKITGKIVGKTLVLRFRQE